MALWMVRFLGGTWPNCGGSGGVRGLGFGRDTVGDWKVLQGPGCTLEGLGHCGGSAAS